MKPSQYNFYEIDGNKRHLRYSKVCYTLEEAMTFFGIEMDDICTKYTLEILTV